MPYDRSHPSSAGIPLNDFGADFPGAGRGRLALVSFLLCAVLPTLLSAVYFLGVASDRYVSGAGFAVRGLGAEAAPDSLGLVTGIPRADRMTPDGYILLEYLESRDLLARLDAELDLRAAYAAPGVDPVLRLAPDATPEVFHDRWRQRIRSSFDPVTGLIRFEVEAFDPDLAQLTAQRVLTHAGALVNDLSEAARERALGHAEAERERAEDRLRAALSALRAFRDREGVLDPSREAEMDAERRGELFARLAGLRARIATLEDRLDSGAPALGLLRSQADTLETQLAEASVQDHVTPRLADYERLQVEKRLAEEGYASALVSLEQARFNAGRQERYLAIYAHPARPVEPTRPRRALSVVLTAVGATLLWGIAALLVLGVRDHLA
ncbi:MAG: hypothetical protein HUJ27_09355 [Rhodobacteraceae bacterium]|nr:hypothetical protein [Paracoccaceae bacterium]